MAAPADPVRTLGNAAPARQVLYGHLADLLTYPSEDLVAALRDGSLVSSLRRAAAAVPYDVVVSDPGGGGEWVLGGEAGLGPAYIRLFDIPSGGRPCPLYGGALDGDRREVMEDLLRYYRHFGLSVAHADERDLPDSVPTVVEFLSYLVFREAEASDDAAADPFRRAQHDVLDRHLARWAPLIQQRVAALDPPPLYALATSLLVDVSSGERAVLATALAGSTGGS